GETGRAQHWSRLIDDACPGTARHHRARTATVSPARQEPATGERKTRGAHPAVAPPVEQPATGSPPTGDPAPPAPRAAELRRLDPLLKRHQPGSRIPPGAAPVHSLTTIRHPASTGPLRRAPRVAPPGVPAGDPVVTAVAAAAGAPRGTAARTGPSAPGRWR